MTRTYISDRSTSSLDTGMELNKNELFRKATEGDWDYVKKLYKEYPETHRERIAVSGDTALHMAVSGGKDREVEQMVQLIQDTHGEMATLILEIRNELGNTPLHLAASQGNVWMCECIARINPKLAGEFNHENYTPFFLAVFHGKKDAFLCLHSIINSGQKVYEEMSRYYIRSDGETILHSAISGQYYDLAFQIIHLYEDLVFRYNESGFTPLHLLASKPSAFPSGSAPVTVLEKIIYHLVSVDLLKFDTWYRHPPVEKPAKFPENYQTCVTFAWSLVQLRHIFSCYWGSRIPKQRIPDVENPQEFRQRKTQGEKKPQPFPPNYSTCIDIFKFIVLSLGLIYSGTVEKMKERKEKHVWSLQIMDELLQRLSKYDYSEYIDTLRETISSDGESKQEPDMNIKQETPLLIAAKHGVLEMVKKILELFPLAIHDMNNEKKNVVLLAVEHRQPHIYMHLQKMKIVRDSIFRKVDKDGNSVLHVAAMRADQHRPPFPGAALQMQWEINWYKFVKNSMPRRFFVRFNKHGKTPKDVFTETHKELVINGGKWLAETSNACSVMAAAIATVAFATSSTVPGGVNEETGMPTLAKEPAFNLFAVSSLIALCSSITALVIFVSILTSRHRIQDFRIHLPRKLLLGLTSLLISITSMLISFCGGHFFLLKHELKFAAFPLYAIICFSMTCFAIAYFPFYNYLIWATFFPQVPKRAIK